MALFRKKPVEVEAVQNLGPEEATGVFPAWLLQAISDGVVTDDATYPQLVIRTLEGDVLCRENDWIIRGVSGELYPCKADIFEKTYDPV